MKVTAQAAINHPPITNLVSRGSRFYL